MVDQAWHANWKDGMEAHQLRRSLFNTSKALSKWNKEHFGFAHTKIKQLKEDLVNTPKDDDLKIQQIRSDLRTQRERMDSILRQKSRET